MPFGGLKLFGSFFLSCLFILLWFFIYKHKTSGAKILAGLAGINIFLMFIIVPWIVSDLTDKAVDTYNLIFYIFISTSHLLFAFFYNAGTYSKKVVTYIKHDFN